MPPLTFPAGAARRLGQRAADDQRLYPRVHGDVRDRPALRRPGTPTDQAWIESLFSHVKPDWPHLDRIKDPEVLRAELAVVHHDYNTIRLHAGIGYVAPADEHAGRGPRIRAARKRGLRHARWARIIYDQTEKLKANRRSPTDGD